MNFEANVTLDEIKRAHGLLKGVIHKTPLDHSRTFSSMAGHDVYLKLENLQKTGSFKIRGAYNKIQSLTSRATGQRRCGGFGRKSCPGGCFRGKRGRD